MLRYEDLYFGNMGGGPLDGYCAVILELGGSREASTSALLSSILNFGRTKVFRLVGDLKKANKEDLYTLLEGLRENNFITMAVLDGKTLEPWMEKVALKIVNISEEGWMQFAVSEIHFQPMKKENIEPPQLRDIHAQAHCYFDVSRDIPAIEVFAFLARYPLWRIYTPPSKIYRMPIAVKEED